MSNAISLSRSAVQDIDKLLSNALDIIESPDEDSREKLRQIALSVLVHASNWHQIISTDIYLPIPWISQQDETASLSTSDCGATCLAMVAKYYGIETTPDKVTMLMNAKPGEYVNALKMTDALKRMGLTCQVLGQFNVESLTPERIESAVSSGKAVVALVDYETLSPIAKFDGLHWIVVCGYTDTKYIICDPLPEDPMEGRIFIRKSLLDEAMTNTREKGAQSQHGLIITRAGGNE